MDTYQKPVMQVKEMFLKPKNNYLKIIVFLSLVLFNKTIFANEVSAKIKGDINNYLTEISEFSAQFTQINNGDISEGKIFLKNKRIRIDYLAPTKITIILTNNKAMFYNHDLFELEYFNPKETLGNVFYNIFYNNNFFKDIKIYNKKSYVVIEKFVFLNEEQSKIIIYFEKKPFILKKIETTTEDASIKISFSNINHNPIFKQKFFSMVNPTLN